MMQQPDHTLRLYKTVALLILVLSIAGLANIILVIDELGGFGGQRYDVPPANLILGITNNALLAGALWMAIATMRSPDAVRARNRLIAAAAALGAALAIFLLVQP
jgi:hypothetical protein